MRLDRVQIRNFRSIQDAHIDFTSNCRILVGINESGKSNILKALSTISKDFAPSSEDVREPLPKETSVTTSHVWFVFDLDDAEINKAHDGLKAFVASKKQDPAIIKFGPSKLSLKKFCSNRSEAIYCVDLITKSKYGSYWGLGDGYQILPNWKKPSKECPSDVVIEVEGKHKPLKNFLLINTDDYPEIDQSFLAEISADDLNDALGEHVSKIVEGSIPKVVVWKYDESNLLPSVIELDQFISDPKGCLPLKNMFALAGITDCAAELTNAKALGGSKLRNLLNRVATHATTHFREVWKEYREIRFALTPNGNKIEANIAEKNYWPMSQRSDGFKRFITFLLNISANVKTNSLSGALLLVDEPDVGLHPSGSKHLRDELISNSKNNYVVFSTHSIFMIDRKNIGRHIIVKKENEKTAITSATKSNFVDEEVLFQALNFTVFEILKQDNLIFEGWRDKRLYQVATATIRPSFASKLRPFKTALTKAGLCHAEGVKDIRNITPVIELAARRCLIVSDADKPAREKQSEYLQLRGFGKWLRYDEVMAGCKADTGEDFLTQKAFATGLSKLMKLRPTLHGAPAIVQYGKIKAVRDWLNAQGQKPDEAKETLSILKGLLFDNLDVTDISDEYFEYLILLGGQLSKELHS